MKAVRLQKSHTQPVIDEVPDPKISGPLDVIVKIGGAGVCRTDLHIIEASGTRPWAPRCRTSSATRTRAGCTRSARP